MSERAAAFGKRLPPVTIDHDGRTYTFSLAITEGVLAEIETRLFDRAVAGLAKMRTAYPEAEYVKRLDTLRDGYAAGDYDPLQSVAVQKHLQSPAGAVFLLAIMGGITEKELIPLFAAKRTELTELLTRALGISLPMKRPKDPKVKGRAKKKR